MSIRLNGVDCESTIHELSSMKHGTYVLADNPNIYEIQRTNNFEFIVTDLDGLIKANTAPEDGDIIENVQEVIRLSVQEAFIPHFSQNVLKVTRGNNVVKFAGWLEDWDGGDMSFTDYIGAETKEALMAWQNKSYDMRTEKVGLVTDYKKDCYVIEYTPDYQEVRRWKMHGCWISKLSEDNTSHTTNDLKKVSVTITYDYATIDRTGGSTTSLINSNESGARRAGGGTRYNAIM